MPGQVLHGFRGASHFDFAVSSDYVPAVCRTSVKYDWKWDDLTPLEYLPLHLSQSVAERKSFAKVQQLEFLKANLVLLWAPWRKHPISPRWGNFGEAKTP